MVADKTGPQDDSTSSDQETSALTARVNALKQAPSSVALESVDGDQELLADVIGVYLDECPRLLRELGEAIEAKDFKTVQRTAHTIKGSSRIFGNTALIESGSEKWRSEVATSIWKRASQIGKSWKRLLSTSANSSRTLFLSRSDFFFSLG